MGLKSNEYADLHQEITWLKQNAGLIRDAVAALEDEKDNLRQAVRKLKLENGRVKQKMKKMQEQIKALGGVQEDSDVEDADYDDIGKDFILVGGAQDPLSIRYEVTLVDVDGVQHKSAERYYWYKMAEKFNDADARDRIHSAPNTPKAEEAMKEIKGFDEATWDEVKLAVWETGQRYKLEQVRWILNLLIESGTSYIAVSHQDKVLGTGWRKNRDESNKPIFWDGANMGGKYLMRYRKKMMDSHAWAGPNEKEETQKRYHELRRFVWRRVDPAVRRGVMPPTRGSSRGRARGASFAGSAGGSGGTRNGFASFHK